MSVERVQRAKGRVWRVRWRDADGRERSRVIGNKRDAELFDAELRRRRRIGQLAFVDAGNRTLGEFVEQWWREYARVELQPNTQRCYASVWDAHIEPRLSSLRLNELTPPVVARFRTELVTSGVGPAAVAKTLTLLQGVLRVAVEQELIARNPVQVIRKPAVRRQRQIEPLAPEAVERIRDKLLEAGRDVDAALVSVLAYAGLRPGEALALQWRHIRARTILIEQAVANGKFKRPKGNKPRTVRLLAALGEDLEQLRARQPDDGPDGLLFPDPSGEPWSEDRWRNWRKRVFAPAARAVGIATPRPYDLRHSFVSLLIHEGRNPVEVAQQAGHAPTMCLSTYAHVFAEGAGPGARSAEAVIASARITPDGGRATPDVGPGHHQPIRKEQ